MKPCRRCGVLNPILSFRQRKGGIIDHTCRQCLRDQDKAWRLRNPDKTKAYYIKHRKYNIEKSREYKLKSVFNLTSIQYQKMYTEQDGKCAICLKAETSKRLNTTKSLSVDHSHLTGKIRQLLCTKCNSALGLLYESKATLQRMIGYIEKHEDKS